jgi:hypothetical protein
MTLVQMAKEVKGLARSPDYAWLNIERISEVDNSVISLSKSQEKSIEQRRINEQGHWQTALERHCTAMGTVCTRSLSKTDATLLSAAIELKSILVTDEWPLNWVAENFDYDDGTPIEVMLSIDVLALLEAGSVIEASERHRTYQSWRQSGELLHRSSDNKYLQLFSESPPTAQG